MSDDMAWIWDNSNGNTVLKKVVDDYYVKGKGVMEAFYEPTADYGKGAILLKSINPND